jgi:hypothetical protein
VHVDVDELVHDSLQVGGFGAVHNGQRTGHHLTRNFFCVVCCLRGGMFPPGLHTIHNVLPCCTRGWDTCAPANQRSSVRITAPHE